MEAIAIVEIDKEALKTLRKRFKVYGAQRECIKFTGIPRQTLIYAMNKGTCTPRVHDLIMNYYNALQQTA